jgi:uncharacterized protein YkwD
MRPILPTTLLSCLLLTGLLMPFPRSNGQEAKTKDSGPPRSDAGTTDPLLADLLVAHNKVRAKEKLPPLKVNAKLTDAARGHARDMAEQDKLSHEGSDGSDPPKRIKRAGYVYKDCGENVACGQETVAEVMRTWMESPPHRKNILAEFTEMGGAVAKTSDGENYWCVDFGQPIPPVDPVKSPQALIAALNGARAEAKKRSLKADPLLTRIAARFARGAAARKSLDTKAPDGKTPFDALKDRGFEGRLAIILATGEGDPEKVVASWLKEPRDRDSLLSGFNRAGAGVATDSDGLPYWVLLLTQGRFQSP